jgi:hypothetical protein
MAAAEVSEGDILREILIAIEAHDTNRERELLARLPRSKTKSKQTLVETLKSWPPYLIECLKELVPFPGLWSGVKLVGNIGRLNSLNMPEVGPSISGTSAPLTMKSGISMLSNLNQGDMDQDNQR